MIKPKISCVYLDMDGVIADFVKRYKELYHMEPREAEKHKKFDHFFDEFIAAGKFAQLDLMPGARELLTFLNHLYLTAAFPQRFYHLLQIRIDMMKFLVRKKTGYKNMV